MAINTSVTIHGSIGSQVVKNDSKGRKNKVYGLGFPIGNRLSGGFFQKRSGLDLVKGNIRQLLQTEKGERVMLPNYGCNLRQYLLPLDEITFREMKQEILTSLSKYSRGTEVLKLRIFPSDDNRINISLIIRIKEIEGATAEVGVTI